MEPNESIVRVWRGLDSLEAQFLRQSLLSKGIECYLDRDIRRLDLGMTDLGLWVAKRDGARARRVVEEWQAETRAQLSRDSESGLSE